MACPTIEFCILLGVTLWSMRISYCLEIDVLPTHGRYIGEKRGKDIGPHRLRSRSACEDELSPRNIDSQTEGLRENSATFRGRLRSGGRREVIVRVEFLGIVRQELGGSRMRDEEFVRLGFVHGVRRREGVNVRLELGVERS